MSTEILHSIENNNIIGSITVADNNIVDNKKYNYNLIKTAKFKYSFTLSVYSVPLLKGLISYFENIMNIIQKKSATYNNNKSHQRTFAYNNIYVAKFYAQASNNNNVNHYVKQHKDDDFTYEMIIEFLIRNSDPEFSLTTTEVKELVSNHVDLFKNNNDFKDDINYINIIRYCIPLYSNNNMVDNLLSILCKKDLAIFNRKNIINLSKLCHYKTHNFMHSEENSETLFKDYEYYKNDNFSGLESYTSLPLFLTDDEILEKINDLPIKKVDFLRVLLEDSNSKNIILEFIEDIKDDKNYNNLTTMIISDNDVEYINSFCKRIHEKYNHYSSISYHLGMLLIKAPLDDKNNHMIKPDNVERFLIDYILINKNNLNFQEYSSLENYLLEILNFGSKYNINGVLYFLRKKFNLEDTVMILNEHLNDNINLTFEQWYCYINNYEDYKRMPLSWTTELL